MQQFTTEELNTEEWRDVPGYEGFYQVSNLGRVRSVDRVVVYGRYHRGQTKIHHGKICIPALNTNGHLNAHLSRLGSIKTCQVHCLVALAFHGSRPPRSHVHHLDENPLNNRAGNLVYLLKGVHRSLHSTGEENPRAKLTDEQVGEIRQLAANGLAYPAIASRFGVSKSLVGQIARNEIWSHLLPHTDAK